MGCARRTTPYMWREQAIREWSWCVNSIVTFCHSAKLCVHTAQVFWSQQNGSVTRMWRSCQVQPSQKERAICAVHYKNEGMLLQPLCWHCVECVIYHKWDVREEQHHIYVARTSNNRVIVARELYCYLLPQCKALRTCRLGFLIATVWIFHTLALKVLTLWELVYDIFLPRFWPKTSSFWLPYQCHSSSVDCARELFKGLNGSPSLLVCTWKNKFLVGVADFLSDVISRVVFGSFCVTFLGHFVLSSFWVIVLSFEAILAHVTWPGAQPLGQSISLKFLLETRLEFESFEP